LHDHEKQFLLAAGQLSALKFLQKKGKRVDDRIISAKRTVDELRQKVNSVRRRRRTLSALISVASLVVGLGAIKITLDAYHSFVGPARATCYPRHPDSGKMDQNDTEKRPCFPGRLTFVSWNFPWQDQHSAAKQQYPVPAADKANRALTLVRADGKKKFWSEQNLVEIAKDGNVWDKNQTGRYSSDWIEVEPTLFLRLFDFGVGRKITLRRDRCHGGATSVRTLEYFTDVKGGLNCICVREVDATCVDGWPIGNSEEIPVEKRKYLFKKHDPEDARANACVGAKTGCIGKVIKEEFD
jgi:hypothetical protein